MINTAVSRLGKHYVRNMSCPTLLSPHHVKGVVRNNAERFGKSSPFSKKVT